MELCILPLLAEGFGSREAINHSEMQVVVAVVVQIDGSALPSDRQRRISAEMVRAGNELTTQTLHNHLGTVKDTVGA
jgi:hypothetical protein